MYLKYGKRVFDLLLALFLVVVLLPVFVISSLTILILDGFPIFYTQKRVGRQGEFFQIYKFRTMKKDSDTWGTVTFENDLRIVKGGKFMRKFKIDEMAQLLNVVLGNMSIVGPRPTVINDFDRMNSEQRKRADVYPGLTGLAQISGNTSLSWPDRINYDLNYIKSISFFGDMKIIFLTFYKIIGNSIDSDPPVSGEW